MLREKDPTSTAAAAFNALRIPAAVASIGVIGAFALGKFNGFTDVLKDAIPHQEVKVDANNTLSNIELPNKTILVQGDGHSTVNVKVRPESDIPLIGGLFNNTVAPLADMTASATRVGSFQIGTKPGAMSLRAHTVTSPETQKEETRIQVDVDVSKIYPQKSEMRYAVKDGKKQHFSSNDLLALPTADGVTKRIGWVTEWADASFANACGKTLVSYLEDGAKVNVKGIVEDAAELQATRPGMQKDAKLLAELAQRPINVRFYKNQKTVTGKIVKQFIPVEQIKLPASFVPDSKTLAKQLDKSPEHVNVDAGSQRCIYDEGAVKDRNTILGEPKNTPAL